MVLGGGSKEMSGAGKGKRVTPLWVLINVLIARGSAIGYRHLFCWGGGEVKLTQRVVIVRWDWVDFRYQKYRVIGT